MPLYNFTSFEFTTGGKFGCFGPTRAELLAAYDTQSNPWLNDLNFFDVVGPVNGIQAWKVPQTGLYRIKAFGAGSNLRASNGIRGVQSRMPLAGGAIMQGDFVLEEGTWIYILCGQRPARNLITSTNEIVDTRETGRFGGHGGTFVVKKPPGEDVTLADALIVAGGAGGANANFFNAPANNPLWRDEPIFGGNTVFRESPFGFGTIKRTGNPGLAGMTAIEIGQPGFANADSVRWPRLSDTYFSPRSAPLYGPWGALYEPNAARALNPNYPIQHNPGGQEGQGGSFHPSFHAQILELTNTIPSAGAAGAGLIGRSPFLSPEEGIVSASGYHMGAMSYKEGGAGGFWSPNTSGTTITGNGTYGGFGGGGSFGAITTLFTRGGGGGYSGGGAGGGLRLAIPGFTYSTNSDPGGGGGSVNNGINKQDEFDPTIGNHEPGKVQITFLEPRQDPTPPDPEPDTEVALYSMSIGLDIYEGRNLFIFSNAENDLVRGSGSLFSDATSPRFSLQALQNFPEAAWWPWLDNKVASWANFYRFLEPLGFYNDVDYAQSPATSVSAAGDENNLARRRINHALWTVPLSGKYRLRVRGGMGLRHFLDDGNSTTINLATTGVAAFLAGGRGAYIKATVELFKGEKLVVVFGKAGHFGGGGGCSAVYREDAEEPLVIAGGGGGYRPPSQSWINATGILEPNDPVFGQGVGGADASFTPDGKPGLSPAHPTGAISAPINGAGGTGGFEGESLISDNGALGSRLAGAGGGGGWRGGRTINGNPQPCTWDVQGSFTNPDIAIQRVKRESLGGRGRLTDCTIPVRHAWTAPDARSNHRTFGGATSGGLRNLPHTGGFGGGGSVIVNDISITQPPNSPYSDYATLAGGGGGYSGGGASIAAGSESIAAGRMAGFAVGGGGGSYVAPEAEDVVFGYDPLQSGNQPYTVTKANGLVEIEFLEAIGPPPPPPPPPPPELDLFNLPILVTSYERLVTNTPIRKTRTGERRTTLRRPRLELVYEVLTASRLFEGFKSQYLTVGAGPWEVPILRDLVRLSSTAEPGVLSVFAPNFHGDFRPGTKVILYNPDGVQIEVREVDVALSQQLVFTEQTAIACNAVAPLRSALLTNGIQLTQINPHNRLLLNFVCLDDAGDFGESPFPQYKGLDFFADPNVTADPLQLSFKEKFAFVDNQSGNPLPVLLQDYLENFLQLNITANGNLARWKLKKWLASLNGKSKPFWLPDYTFKFDLIQNIAAASQTMQVKRLLGNPENFIGKHIIIEEEGQEPLLREITGVAIATSLFVQFEIDSPPGREISFKTSTVNLLRKVRLDTDEIEIYGSTFGKVNLPLQEVPE